MCSRAGTIVPELLDLDTETRPGSPGGRISFVPLSVPRDSHAARVDPVLAAVMSVNERAISRANAQPVHALGYYSLAEALVTGEGYPWIDGRLACTRATMPGYWQAMVLRAGLRDPEGLTERVIPSPAVLFHARDYNNYGHFWLDIAPRLFLLKREQPREFSTLAFIVPGDIALWASDVLRSLYGITTEQLVAYDPAHERLLCARLLLPTLVHADYAFHPLANAFYDDVVDHCREASPGPSGTFLYLTRRPYTRDVRPRARRLTNAEEVEELAEALGLRVVAPELLPWRAQVALFAQAHVVVGEHGSAMKNLLFAPAGSVAVSMTYLNTTQSRIAALRAQGLVTILAEGKRPAQPPPHYRVDLERLRAAIEAAKRWFDASQSAKARPSVP